MKAIVLAGLALWIAAGCGRALLGRLHIWQRVSAEERFAYAAATGLGVAAYGVFALGLLGQLSFWPVTLLWGLLAATGARSMLQYGRELAFALRPGFSGLRAWQWMDWCGVGTLLICGGVALLACFLPPMGREWDAISYHLADPKLFLQMGRMVSLPTEHHSNFPFTMEMLFTVGLLYAGYPLANLFHFLTGVLTVVALTGFCRRRWSVRAGVFAGMLYVTTPAVLWQCGVAYIDVALGLYVLLATLAAVYAVERGGRDAVAWGGVAGLAMGFGLGIKYLALLPYGLIALYLLMRRVAWRAVLIYLSVALLIGAPWYVKNWVINRNPVYPFAYSLFPHSRYWSADRASAYQSEQSSFGYRISLRQPREAILNSIQFPWRLVSDADRYANRGDYTFTSLFGGAFAALGVVLVLMRGVPGATRDLFSLSGVQLVLWLFVAQVGRYLIPILPVLSIACGFVVWRLVCRPVASSEDTGGGASIAAGLRYGALCLVFGQAMLLF
ncbi:MAG: glycosyltransferase family 39 protein, partial [Chthonomonadaceae bacterium]|nr:glycosyltransferase family 39 protein [Chthonomonadaceae bacterium]